MICVHVSSPTRDRLQAIRGRLQSQLTSQRDGIETLRLRRSTRHGDQDTRGSGALDRLFSNKERNRDQSEPHFWTLQPQRDLQSDVQRALRRRYKNVWNALSTKTVEAASTTVFKSRLKSESFEKYLMF